MYICKRVRVSWSIHQTSDMHLLCRLHNFPRTALWRGCSLTCYGLDSYRATREEVNGTCRDGYMFYNCVLVMMTRLADDWVYASEVWSERLLITLWKRDLSKGSHDDYMAHWLNRSNLIIWVKENFWLVAFVPHPQKKRVLQWFVSESVWIHRSERPNVNLHDTLKLLKMELCLYRCRSDMFACFFCTDWGYSVCVS